MKSRSAMNDEKLLEDADRAMLRRYKRAVADRQSTMDDLSKYTAVVDKIRNRLMTRHQQETAIRIARIRAGATAARQRPKRPADAEQDGELESMLAPYGRKKDGTPHTHQEFCDTLRLAVSELYGIDFDATAAAGSTRPRTGQRDAADSSALPSQTAPDHE